MDSLTRLAAALGSRYRLELGQGGMATVYLARDLRHKRDVAIEARDVFLVFWKLQSWRPLKDDPEGFRILRSTGL